VADIVFVLIVLAFFGIAVLYVGACARIADSAGAPPVQAADADVDADASEAVAA
jgi:hypothetical protein